MDADESSVDSSARPDFSRSLKLPRVIRSLVSFRSGERGFSLPGYFQIYSKSRKVIPLDSPFACTALTICVKSIRWHNTCIHYLSEDDNNNVTKYICVTYRCKRTWLRKYDYVQKPWFYQHINHFFSFLSFCYKTKKNCPLDYCSFVKMSDSNKYFWTLYIRFYSCCHIFELQN